LPSPSLDVGHFRASLIDSGMKLIDDETLASPDECDAYLADLQELADVFLARYEALAPVSRTRLMLWEGLDYLRDALQLWTKARPARPEAVTRILEHHWRRTDLLPNPEVDELGGWPDLDATPGATSRMGLP
jgi:hypothetical protein